MTLRHILNIRLGFDCLSEINTLAYFLDFQIIQKHLIRLLWPYPQILHLALNVCQRETH
jgi:hypothetical protein